MKLRKQLFKALLCVLILAQLVPCLALGIGASDTATAEDTTPDGLSFSQSAKYVQQKPLWGVPEDIETVVTGAGTSYEATKTLDNGVLSGAITFETMIYIPSTLAGNSITLFSNLWGKNATSESYLNTLSFEITYAKAAGSGWFPSIKITDADNSSTEIHYRMYGSKIPKDTWTHVAVTFDTTKTDANGNYDYHIYYNGKNVDSSKYYEVKNHTGEDDFGKADGLYNADNYILGGTYDQARDGHFGGYLQSFSVFNEARSAAQIAEDCAKGFNLTDEGSSANTFDAREMLCYYEFSRESVGRAAISDLSPMGNDLLLIGGTEGIPFTHKDFLVMDKELSALPLTLEARVTVPSKGKFYPILYGFAPYGNILAWGIQGRQVKLYYAYKINGSSKEASVTFDQSINYLTANQWADVAVTADFENLTFKCYVNGELVQTITPTGDSATLFTNAATVSYLNATFVVGSNCAWGNTANYYTGKISEIALYSDIRGEEEIRIDHQYGYSTKDEALIAEYDLTTLVGAENVIDKTGNGHHLRSDTWMTEEEADLPTDYAYSFAVVGDTQFLSRYNVSGFEDNLDNLYKWILDNQERFKTQHVFGVGDIVESGEEATNNPSGINEWEKAYKAISQMDGKISYSLVRGRAHDDPTLFNQYMGTEAYYAMFKGSEEYGFYKEGRIDSTWRTFTVGQTKYLFLMLDYGIGGDLIPWAEEIIASHPDHRVIITTHKYLNTDGTLEGTGEAGFAAFGKYDNVELVLCGHAGGEDIVYRRDMSPEGNLHTSMMINSQSMDKYYPNYGGFGMVAMLYFSEDGNTVTVRYYSTVLERYFRPGNQFTLKLNEGEAEKPKITGAYLNLTDNINVLYSASVPAEYENPYMVFEYNGESYTVSKYTVAEDGEWLFAFEGVTPQMAGENIKATLIATKDGVEKRVEKAEYSVLTYCKNMLSKTTDAKLKTLLSDLLVYAAASQTYMDYKTDALVTEGLSLTPSTFAPLASTDKALHGTEDARVEWKGAALRYENAMAMKFNFKADKALTLKITVGERSEIYTSDDWETDENGNYVVYFRGILATEYDDVVTAVLYENDAQVGENVTYSVNSYVYSMQNEGGTLGALVQATYNYGASAESYN